MTDSRLENMAGANGQAQPAIDKRDFDRNRQSGSPHEPNDLLGSRPHSSLSMSNRFSDNNDGLLSDVVEEIVERDRRKIARKVVRIGSFVWGIVTW